MFLIQGDKSSISSGDWSFIVLKCYEVAYLWGSLTRSGLAGFDNQRLTWVTLGQL